MHPLSTWSLEQLDMVHAYYNDIVIIVTCSCICKAKNGGFLWIIDSNRPDRINKYCKYIEFIALDFDNQKQSIEYYQLNLHRTARVTTL